MDGVEVWLDEVDEEVIEDRMVFARGFAMRTADVVDDVVTEVLLERTSEAVADVANDDFEGVVLVSVGSDVDMLMLRLSVLFDPNSVCDESDEVCCMLRDADGIETEELVFDLFCNPSMEEAQAVRS